MRIVYMVFRPQLSMPQDSIVAINSISLNKARKVKGRCSVSYQNTPPRLTGFLQALYAELQELQELQTSYGDFAFVECTILTEGGLPEYYTVTLPKSVNESLGENESHTISIAISEKQCKQTQGYYEQGFCEEHIQDCNVSKIPKYVDLFFDVPIGALLSTGIVQEFGQYHISGYFGACQGHSGTKCLLSVADSDYFNGILVHGNTTMGNVCMTTMHPNFMRAYKKYIVPHLNEETLNKLPNEFK